MQVFSQCMDVTSPVSSLHVHCTFVIFLVYYDVFRSVVLFFSVSFLYPRLYPKDVDKHHDGSSSRQVGCAETLQESIADSSLGCRSPVQLVVLWFLTSRIECGDRWVLLKRIQTDPTSLCRQSLRNPLSFLHLS